jgi:hypothetical protein
MCDSGSGFEMVIQADGETNAERPFQRCNMPNQQMA